MGRKKLPRGRCLNCGAELDRRIKRYCNYACQHAYYRKLYINAWIAGNGAVLDNWARPSGHIRSYLFDTFGRCEVCGWAERNPTTGRIPLHIDHIDGDWRNSRPENLRLLCPNHHALTATYGALNRGKGRPFHVIKTPPLEALP